MRLQGLPPKLVDDHIDQFAALMQAGMRKVCKTAADHVHSFALVAAGVSDGDVTMAVDSLGVMSAQWGVYTDEILMPALANVAIDAGKKVVSPLGDVHVADEKTANFLQQMHGWITDFASELWQTAKDALIAGSQDGESIAQLAMRVHNVADVKEKKAKVIAQTAVISAINGGEWQQMMELAHAADLNGVKEWVATHDTHTRPSHLAADGQRVAISGHFDVGGELLLFPGDPSGDPGEIINCRCTTVYDLDVEDQITASQTSLKTLYDSPAAVTNGPILMANGIVKVVPLTAAVNAAFNAQHPRGKDGKFIKKGEGLPGDLVEFIKDAHAGVAQWDAYPEGDKKYFINDVGKVTQTQWANIKDEDKAHINTLLDDAINEGIPGAAKAKMHLEDMDQAQSVDDAPDLFNPDTDITSLVPPVTGTPAHLEGFDELAPSAMKDLDEYYQDGALTDAEHSKFQKAIWNAKSTAQLQAAYEEMNNVANAWYAANNEDGGDTGSSSVIESQINEAAAKDFISADQQSDLLDKLAIDGLDAHEVQPLLMQAMTKHNKAKNKDVEQQIYDAHDAGHIDEQQQQFALDVLDNDGAAAAQAYLAQHVTATPSPSLTTGSSTPVKITHGLIHAKYAPGTIIAKNDDGDTITWNGASYDIKDANGDIVTGDIKKSKLYAHLSTHFGQSQWFSSGKQETEVSHANPLDAAPSLNHIPHPVAAPAIAGPVGSNAAVQHTLDTGEPMYSTNGKYKLVKSSYGGVGVVKLAKKQPGGGWGLGGIVKDGDLPPSAKWKTTEAPSLIGPINEPINEPSTPALNSPSTPAVAQHIDLTGWKQIGGQGGSNLGGLYEAPDGKKYYVKSLKSEAHAKNEVLAAALYNAAGIDVPNVQHGTNHPDGWKNVVVSPLVPNAVSAKSKLTGAGGFKYDVMSGFAVDAWLANYDVVGLTHDNIVESNGKPWRIDVGGSLQYRAQGGKKTDWGDDPTSSLTGLKDKSKNPQAASVFGLMSHADEKESAKKLLGVSDAQIDQLAKDAGLPASMATTLKARKKAILAKYGLSEDAVDVAVPHPLGDTTPSPTVVTETVDVTSSPTHPTSKIADIALHEAYPIGSSIGWHSTPKGLVQVKMGVPGHVLVNTPSDGEYWVNMKVDEFNEFAPAFGLSKWHLGDPPAIATSAVSAVNAPAAGAPNTTTPSLASDLTAAQKFNLYKHFKAEKVSPAWSAAKIYKSMHVAKAKMSGDPQIAALSDSEALKLLDEVHHLSLPPGSVGPMSTPKPAYSTKVHDWLQTPNGVKAFKELNPAIPTPTPSIAKKVAKKGVGAAFAAKKTSGTVTSLTVDEALGDADIGPNTGISDNFKTDLFSAFKSSAHGKYLKEKPENIYWNAVQKGKTEVITPGQVLAIVDEEGAKKFGVPNAHSFTTKVKDWLSKPSGKKKAAEIKNGTWSPSATTSPSTSSFGTPSASAVSGEKYSASLPLSQKVPDVSHNVPAWNKNDATNYPVVSTGEASALWAQMQTTHGSMAPSQQKSLKYYTGNTGFTLMNNYLRGYSGATQSTQTHVNNAQAGMRPTTKPITLHRGNGWFAGWGSYAEIKAKEGTEFKQEAFFSASVGGAAAFGHKPIRMTIECPEGTPMAYVKAFSNYGGENEMLLAAHLSYQIISVTQSGGHVSVHMRVIAKDSGGSS